MLRLILKYLIDFIHYSLMLFPYLIFIIPKKYISCNLKFIFLIILLVPIHWQFFNNVCVLNIIKSNLMNDPKLKKSTPYGSQIINIHYVLAIILIWFYIFYYNKECNN